MYKSAETPPAAPPPAAPPPFNALSPEAADARTARAMDGVLRLLAGGALVGGGLRAARGVIEEIGGLKRIRDWPPSRRAVVTVPYARPRKRDSRVKTARRVSGRSIDPAENMRRLGALPPLARNPDGSNPAVLANLARNAARGPYRGPSTNSEPIGRYASGIAPPKGPPPALGPWAAHDAAGAAHAAGLRDAAAGVRASRPTLAALAAANAARYPDLDGSRAAAVLADVRARRAAGWADADHRAAVAGTLPGARRYVPTTGPVPNPLLPSTRSPVAGVRLDRPLWGPLGSAAALPPEVGFAGRAPSPAPSPAPGGFAGPPTPASWPPTPPVPTRPAHAGAAPVGTASGRPPTWPAPPNPIGGWPTATPFGGLPKTAGDDGASALARRLSAALGLNRVGAAASVARDWLNPTLATSAWDMPWTYAAAPLTAATAVGGYSLADAAINKFLDHDSKAEVAEQKKRYESALRDRVLRKRGAAGDVGDSEPRPLDLLAAARAKEAWVPSATPIGVLLALGTGLTAGGALLGAHVAEGKADPIKRLVRERQLDVLRNNVRPIEVRTEDLLDDDDDDDDEV